MNDSKSFTKSRFLTSSRKRIIAMASLVYRLLRQQNLDVEEKLPPSSPFEPPHHELRTTYNWVSMLLCTSLSLVQRGYTYNIDKTLTV